MVTLASAPRWRPTNPQAEVAHQVHQALQGLRHQFHQALLGLDYLFCVEKKELDATKVVRALAQIADAMRKSRPEQREKKKCRCDAGRNSNTRNGRADGAAFSMALRVGLMF